jgi:hypothetical protein
MGHFILTLTVFCPYILKTPKFVFSMGLFNEMLRPKPRTFLVSAGSMIPKLKTYEITIIPKSRAGKIWMTFFFILLFNWLFKSSFFFKCPL